MIREVIRPQSSDFYLKIPAEYINKTVEFIMFPIDEYELDCPSIRGLPLLKPDFVL